jgi:hypothetical protein
MSVGQAKSAPAGVHRSIDASSRELEKTIRVPSGDQEGQASFGPSVNRLTSLPSAFAT